jgi:hypothetical protein
MIFQDPPEVSAKAAQIQNTLSGLTPVHEVIHGSSHHHAHQYHPHLHGGHLGHHHLDIQGHGAVGQLESAHNFTVDSLMTAQQLQNQHVHHHNDIGNGSDSREGSPAHQHSTPPLEASDGGVAYRAAAAAAAMASWTSNCSQQNYPQQLDDHAHQGGVAIDDHGHHPNYRSWYAMPPAGSPAHLEHHYPPATPPSSSTGATPTNFSTPATPSNRDSYGPSAAAAAAAAAAAYRSSMFHYGQDCNSIAGSTVGEIPKY